MRRASTTKSRSTDEIAQIATELADTKSKLAAIKARNKHGTPKNKIAPDSSRTSTKRGWKGSPEQ